MEKKITNEDIHILETILSQFIPFYSDVMVTGDKSTTIKLIHDLIAFITNQSSGKKKRNSFNYDNNVNLEEKEFLYKTYISSSDTNANHVKFFSKDILQINNLNSQMIRSLLILLKDELMNSKSGILINKLKGVKKLVINEAKPFEFKLLFIMLNFIIRTFCINLRSIQFEGTFHSRIEQVDIMLKNGVYLLFIHSMETLTKYTIINKIEFLNENLAFKILHDYCLKNNITETNPEKVSINKINIFNFIPLKVNMERFYLNKVAIDKNSAISAIVRVLQFNNDLKKVAIDRFISIPMHYRKELITAVSKLTGLKKLKLGIVSACKDDYMFMTVPNVSKLKKFNLRLSRVSIEDSEYDDDSTLPDYRDTNLTELSLYLEKLDIGKTHLIECLLSSRLTMLSLGYIGKKFISSFIQLPRTLRLEKLKFSFLPILDEDYEDVFRNIVTLLENFLLIKNFTFLNFALKYKNIVDEEIKSVIKLNNNLRKLMIQSEVPFHVQTFEGFYYYEYPVVYVENFLPIIKTHGSLAKIYYKKNIVKRVFDCLSVKKDKQIVISYRV
jgi:hypothetical protein